VNVRSGEVTGDTVFHVTHSPLGPLGHLEEELAQLERAGLRRDPDAGLARDESLRATFCSNDYLGMAERVAPRAATGAGGSRLITGERAAHRALERAFAEWLGVEACLAFSSGYAANVGTIAALASPGDLIVSDALNHASIVDGARLSRARIAITPHNDLPSIERALRERRTTEARAWVLVESYYSMDADGPDLRGLRSVCDEHGAGLFVDEAHALGVLGPGGRGRAAEVGVRPDVLVGTLGKAFGSQGAFVAGSRLLREWLWNRARSFVFSTGLAPVAAEAARLALEHLVRTPEIRELVAERAAELRAGLSRCPTLSVGGFGHIVPILVGDSGRALRLAAALRAGGLDVTPIRPPTVPTGTARLRLTVTARHTPADVDLAVQAIASAAARLERA
jgi:8-amino-7-oxononanoate synthase